MNAVLLRAAPRGARRAFEAALLGAVVLSAAACHAPDRAARSRLEPFALDEPRGSFARGKELALRGDSLRAEQYLARALEQGYDPPETLRWLIRVCVDGSRLRAAIHYARPYVEARPDALALRYVVATLHLGLAEPLPAREHLRAVVQRAPSFAEAEALLARVERELSAREVAGAPP